MPLRKHRTQLSQEEIVYTETLVHNLSGWNLAVDHCLDRMKEKKVTKDDVVNTLKWGNVVEVCDNGRVLFRLNTGMRKGTCVVVGLRDKVIVTTWRNNPKDNHQTLRLDEYEWRANVVEFLRETIQ